MSGAPESVDRRLELMGTHIRILVGPAEAPDAAPPERAADRVERLLRDYDRTLSRFRPDSELCVLNADLRPVVPASGLLRGAVRAAVRAAEVSGGLVDPALLDALEDVGYRESWDRARRLDLRAALDEVSSVRKPAAAHPSERWREIEVDDDAGTIARPPGLRIDTGGSGKGHAADLAATMLDGHRDWAVDCGGDVRIGGTSGAARDVEVEDPFSGRMLPGFTMRRGAVATSGIRSRLWRADDGQVVHHLLDPATGRPAFTGLVAVTALAPTAVEAEARAKAALLSGPEGARSVLRRHGGIAIEEAGHAERVGRLDAAPVVRLRLPGSAPA